MESKDVSSDSNSGIYYTRCYSLMIVMAPPTDTAHSPVQSAVQLMIMRGTLMNVLLILLQHHMSTTVAHMSSVDHSHMSSLDHMSLVDHMIVILTLELVNLYEKLASDVDCLWR